MPAWRPPAWQWRSPPSTRARDERPAPLLARARVLLSSSVPSVPSRQPSERTASPMSATRSCTTAASSASSPPRGPGSSRNSSRAYRRRRVFSARGSARPSRLRGSRLAPGGGRDLPPGGRVHTRCTASARGARGRRRPSRARRGRGILGRVEGPAHVVGSVAEVAALTVRDQARRPLVQTTSRSTTRARSSRPSRPVPADRGARHPDDPTPRKPPGGGPASPSAPSG